MTAVKGVLPLQVDNEQGTVTSVSVATANGFAGSVANPTTTPAITLSTTVTGVLKGNGTAISAAVAGTDYAAPTSGASILYGDGAGGFSNVTVGSGLTFVGGTLDASGGAGTVTNTGTLTANELIIGNGTTDVKALGSLGTTTTVLHGNAAGAPTFGAVSLTADVSGILPSANGGTGNGFTKISGPTTAEKTFALPDASATILTTNAAVTVAQGGTGLATLTAENVMLGNGTGNVKFVAPGSSGNVLTSNGTTWQSTAPTAPSVGDHCVTMHTGNGFGSTNTGVRRFTTTLVNTGTAITLTQSAGNGDSFTINDTGLYAMLYQDLSPASSNYLGITVNGSDLTTGPTACTVATRVVVGYAGVTSRPTAISRTMRLTAGDVIRCQAGSDVTGTNDQVYFSITKVGT